MSLEKIDIVLGWPAPVFDFELDLGFVKLDVATGWPRMSCIVSWSNGHIWASIPFAAIGLYWSQGEDDESRADVGHAGSHSGSIKPRAAGGTGSE